MVDSLKSRTISVGVRVQDEHERVFHLASGPDGDPGVAGRAGKMEVEIIGAGGDVDCEGQVLRAIPEREDEN